MKILYITTMYPTTAFPQKGIFCHEQVKALKKLGIDVDVVVPIPFYDREVKQSSWKYEGIDIKYIRFFKLPGSRDFHKTGKSLFYILKYTIDLKQYDLYHADSPLPTGYAMMLAAARFNKPFVVHGHGLDVYLNGSYAGTKNCELISETCKTVYEKANAIVGVSQKVLEKIQTKVNIHDKAYVVYNGVDIDKFKPIKHEILEYYNLISVGNLIPLKGHEYTIRALRKLIDQGYLQVKLSILGRGEQESYLKSLVEELHLNSYVDFLGYIPYDEVVRHMQYSDVFILPSDYEALGCVYLEAMACGLPTIGCNGNGIDEIIQDSENGYLVDEKNPEQIAESIKKIISISNKKISENARKTVVEHYQWYHSAEKLKKIYMKLLT